MAAASVMIQRAPLRGPSERTNDLPGTLPTGFVPEDTDAAEVGSMMLAKLPNLHAADLTEGALWRDFLAFSGTFRTFANPEIISATLQELSKRVKPSEFTLVPHLSMVVNIGMTSWANAFFDFRTDLPLPTKCQGCISMCKDASGAWKIWQLRTYSLDFVGLNSLDDLEPISHDAAANSNDTSADHVYDCVVVGCGQNGLASAGRLKAMGLSYVALEKNPRVGDSWRNRYEGCHLHTTKDHAQTLFERSFGPSDPLWIEAGDLANAQENWAHKFGLNIWTSTALQKASWDAEARTWTLAVFRDGQEVQLRCRHVAFGMGTTGTHPAMPSWSENNRSRFKGIAMHSQQFRSAKDFAGKKCVIIGVANTAHDIAGNMRKYGAASITLYQRGPTFVLRRDDFLDLFLNAFNQQLPVEISDRMFSTGPHKVTHLMASGLQQFQASTRPEMYKGLEEKGFQISREKGGLSFIYERAGGHLMDIDLIDRILDGTVKIKSGTTPVGFTEHGIEFADGTELEADVVIFATGYDINERKRMAAYVGDEMAEKLDDHWGLDAEGEIRGSYKPCGQSNLWMLSGDFSSARLLSRFLALQIQAEISGKPYEPFDDSFGEKV